MSRLLFALMLLATGTSMAAYGQVASTTYRLQPEDVISIRVYGEPDLTVDSPIGTDGTISFPFLGFILVAGKTTTEVGQYIKSELIRRQYFTDPKITVNILRFRTLRGSVVGFVQKAGQYEFKPGDRILTLISQAGGPLQDNSSDLKHATLIRRGSSEQIPLDLYAMLMKGDLSQNYELQDGDVINVPQTAMNRINITGWVLRPGQVAWREGMTLADAIAIGGGDIPLRSRMSKVQIQRAVPGREWETVRFTVDFTKFQNKNDFSQNPVLEPGDIIFVPSSKNIDLEMVSRIANIAFTVNQLASRNFGFFPRF